MPLVIKVSPRNVNVPLEFAGNLQAGFIRWSMRRIRGGTSFPGKEGGGPEPALPGCHS